MDKENTNQNITPVFWDENDGKWHFTEKCLNPEFQITYVTNPHTFETPDEAMQASGIVAEIFREDGPDENAGSKNSDFCGRIKNLVS